jgi:hypothetical protein
MPFSRKFRESLLQVFVGVLAYCKDSHTLSQMFTLLRDVSIEFCGERKFNLVKLLENNFFVFHFHPTTWIETKIFVSVFRKNFA